VVFGGGARGQSGRGGAVGLAACGLRQSKGLADCGRQQRRGMLSEQRGARSVLFLSCRAELGSQIETEEGEALMGAEKQQVSIFTLLVPERQSLVPRNGCDQADKFRN
jgi:hypothetical protein